MENKEYYAGSISLTPSGTKFKLWRMFRDDRDPFIENEYDVDLNKIKKFNYSKYNKLISTTGWVYFNIKEVNWLLETHGYKAIEPSGCSICSKYETRGFIPMMNFYSGCPECNSDDKKNYTLFEISEKLRREST